MSLDNLNNNLSNPSNLYNSYEIQVIIEIPYHSNVKYEIDDNGQVHVDRILSTSMVYPGNYGYIPETRAGDGDPVDVLIMNHVPFVPGSSVMCRVIGVLDTEDEKGMDEKIIAVPIDRIDRRYSHRVNILDIAETERNMVRHFFENYKQLETGKYVNVMGYRDRDAAMGIISQSYIVRCAAHRA